MLPIFAIAMIEKHVGGPWLNLPLNLAFMNWAIYDVRFTSHYAHGLNTLHLIFPMLVAFAGYWALVLPMVMQRRTTVVDLARIAGVAANGAVYAGLMLLDPSAP